ncbi:MAG: carbohydrate-binding domain-containing protein [Mariniblastus sp.]
MFRKSTKPTEKTSPLNLETLEERNMLSVVTVAASGDMGGEFFDLQINGESEGSFRVTQEYAEFRVDVPSTVTADQVRVVFTGDLYRPESGIDQNLNVDFIKIDGRKFETEAANTYASGVWDSVTGTITEGFFQTEKLSSNGYFQFGDFPASTYDSTIIEIDARGTGGDGERIDLQINGVTVESFILSDNPLTGGFDGPDQFVYEADGIVTADDIRIAFNNDDMYETFFKGTVSVVDRNLTVQSITVAGQKYNTDSDTVFSVGVWDNEAGAPGSGFGQGNTLHTNGYFQYSATPTTTTVIVDTSTARGDGERYDLQINGATVAQTVLSDNPFQGGYQGQRELVFEAPGDVSISDIRIVYTNDAIFQRNLKGLISTIDRNLRINSVSVDGVTYLTDDSSVFSTGVWNDEDGAPRRGFGIGDTLHVNGYFQYGAR